MWLINDSLYPKNYGLPPKKKILATLHEDYNVACITYLKGIYIKGNRTKTHFNKVLFTHELQNRGVDKVQQMRSYDNSTNFNMKRRHYNKTYFNEFFFTHELQKICEINIQQIQPYVI